MAITKQEILIEFQAVDKNVQAKMDLFGKSLKELETRTIITNKGFLRQTQTTEKQVNMFGKWETVQKKVIKGMNGFRMEALGIMFGGMAITRAFNDLSKGAMDWLGVNELMSTSVDVLMLNSLLPFTDTLYGAAESIFNIADGTDAASVALRGFLGASSIVGMAAGVFLQTFGQIFLFLTSITQAFPSMKAVTAPAIGALATGFGVLLGNVQDTNPLINTLGTVMATIGSALTVLPLADAASDAEILGIRAGEATGAAIILAAAGAGFFASNGIGNVMNLLTGSATNAKNAIEGTRFAVTNLDGTTADITLTVTDFISPKLDSIEARLRAIGVQGPSQTITTPSGAVSITSQTSTTSQFSNTYSQYQQSLANIVADFFGQSKAFLTSTEAGRLYLGTGIRYNPFSSSPYSYQSGGVVPGRMGEPVPVIAHGGEKFLGTGESGTGGTIINVSPSYYITVSDRQEMEEMIKKNNEDLVNDIRRLTFSS